MDWVAFDVCACRESFGDVAIFLCLWHVRRAWLKHSWRKMPDPYTRNAVLKQLGDVMYGINACVGVTPEEWALERLEDLNYSYPLARDFLRYIRMEWVPKLSMWITGARYIPHASQDTNAAIESWHGNLKARLRSGKQRLDGRRIDWLISELVGPVLTHYWYRDNLKSKGFKRNVRQEEFISNVVWTAREIPDVNVHLPTVPGHPAIVDSVQTAGRSYTIYAPATTWACCDCPWALKGNLCKHQIRVLQLMKPNLKEGLIVKLCGTKLGTIHGGLHMLMKSELPDIDAEEEVVNLAEPTECSASSRRGRQEPSDVSSIESEMKSLSLLGNESETMRKHLLAELRCVRGRLSTLQVRIDKGLLHPLQAVPFIKNDDGNNMSLARKVDFVDRFRSK